MTTLEICVSWRPPQRGKLHWSVSPLLRVIFKSQRRVASRRECRCLDNVQVGAREMDATLTWRVTSRSDATMARWRLGCRTDQLPTRCTESLRLCCAPGKESFRWRWNSSQTTSGSCGATRKKNMPGKQDQSANRLHPFVEILMFFASEFVAVRVYSRVGSETSNY